MTKNKDKEQHQEENLAEETVTEETATPQSEEETAEAKEASAKDTPKEEDEDLNTKYLRLMADFQNYKRRSEKERGDIHAYANEKIVNQLLEVMDNFERALNHDSDDNFKEGMVMIFNQLKEVLKKSGVEEIEAENAEFDPNFHNAVMMEDTDAVESGKVSQVLQKGYTLNGKVIRPSMVKVAN
ncbi:MAG: nucleotide exchange factor GrpE [Anaerovoracaceae bacterium]